MSRRSLLARVGDAFVGRPLALSDEVLDRHPELAEARWRAGGLPLRVGGWCLGQSTVSGITLWRTIWLADPASASPRLLLHELAHVRQFAEQPAFPALYCWESLRRGYYNNRYETEADAFADAQLGEARPARSRAD